MVFFVGYFCVTGFMYLRLALPYPPLESAGKKTRPQKGQKRVGALYTTLDERLQASALSALGTAPLDLCLVTYSLDGPQQNGGGSEQHSQHSQKSSSVKGTR